MGGRSVHDTMKAPLPCTDQESQGRAGAGGEGWLAQERMRWQGPLQAHSPPNDNHGGGQQRKGKGKGNYREGAGGIR